MHLSRISVLLLLVLGLWAGAARSQDSLGVRFFEPAPAFNKTRFWTSAAVGATMYTGVMIGLNEIWYADYPRSSFQLFNDMGEWQNMDKFGHSFTAYFETSWAFSGAQWTGMERRKSLWLASSLGSLFQASIEVLDGFSEQWGFSIADIGFNTIGVGLFVGQELLWEEQRILLKVSSGNPTYPDVEILSENGEATYNLRQRADDLYGGSYAASFLKDYNAMTIWISANPKAFAGARLPDKFPSWLNFALGIGAGNLYGGFANEWEDGDLRYRIPDGQFQRYQQFYLSPDIDFRRIPVRKPFLKMLLHLANIFKVPAPALEINTLGKAKWHWLHF